MKRWPYWVYVIAAGLIWAPVLVHSGFVLTLDMVFAPHMPWPSFDSSSALFYAVFNVLNVILPADWLQKMLLVGIVLLCGIGAHRLTQYSMPKSLHVERTAYYFAGLLYIFNPFVYSRFMAGQFAVLLGYALLPFFVRSLLVFLQKPTIRGGLQTAGWLTAIAIVSIHTLGLAAVIGMCLYGALLVRTRRTKHDWVVIAKTTGIGIIAFVVANCYWLLPYIFGTSDQSGVARGISDGDRQVFATAGDGVGIVGNVLSLHGFWADNKALYLIPKDLYSWWLIPVVILWGLAVFGVVVAWRSMKRVTIAFVVAFIVAVVLAIGTAGTVFASVNQWLIDGVPFFAGYREPQKFVGLCALVLVCFAAIGLAAVLHRVRAWNKEYIPFVDATAAILPLCLAPMMVFAFHSQIKAAPYPADWYTVNRQLSEQDNVRVLILPWHQYMRFDFAGRVVASPYQKFFDFPVVASSNPELRGVTSWPLNEQQKNIEQQVLPAAAKGQQIAPLLRESGITHVLLVKEHDYKKYQYLDAQNGLRVIDEGPTTRLYRVDGIQ